MSVVFPPGTLGCISCDGVALPVTRCERCEFVVCCEGCQKRHAPLHTDQLCAVYADLPIRLGWHGGRSVWHAKCDIAAGTHIWSEHAYLAGTDLADLARHAWDNTDFYVRHHTNFTMRIPMDYAEAGENPDRLVRVLAGNAVQLAHAALLYRFVRYARTAESNATAMRRIDENNVIEIHTSVDLHANDEIVLPQQ